MSSEKLKGVFQQLRHLSGEITSNTAELKARIEAPAKEDLSSKAVLKLQEIRKDVKNIKLEAQEKLKDCQKERADFGALIVAVRQLVEYQQNGAQQVEDYMKQYGYTTWAEKQEAEEKEKSKKEETVIVDSSEEASACVKTPESRPPDRRKGTPKLEDFGLSEYTFQALRLHSEVKPEVSTQQVEVYVQAPGETFQREPLVEQTVNASCAPTPVSKPYYAGSPLVTPLHPKKSRAMRATPDLKDFGLSEMTMQSLNMMEYESQIVSDTSHAVQLEKSKYGYQSPAQAEPDIFRNNGLVVTPSLVGCGTLNMGTPSYHLGGVKGYEAKEVDRQVNETVLKLEDYLDSADPPPVRSNLSQPPKLTLLSSRLPPCRMDNHTPPEPEFLSFRLQMLQKASDSGSLELSTPDRMALNKTGRVGKSAASDFPAPPRLKGRYHFGRISEDSENIPPSYH